MRRVPGSGRSRDPVRVPNPGSDEAVRQGCTCPVLDNSHGRGARVSTEGEVLFWFTSGCPVHSVTPEAKEGDSDAREGT